MPQKLTKRVLDGQVAKARQSAKPGADVFCFDSVVPGFAARIRGGRARFVFRYKLRGRLQRITIGDYGALTVEQARALASKHYLDIRGGGDPAAARRESRVRGATFADAAGLYVADLEQRAKLGAARGRKSTAAEFDRLLSRCILPKLGRKEIATIGLADLQTMHRALAATPVQANRALTVASAVLGFAELRGLRPIGSNPAEAVERFAEQGRRGRLNLTELAQLGESLREAERSGSEHPSALLAVRLLALTGLRRSEVLGHSAIERRGADGGLRWRDVDLEARVIELRMAKAGARTVPLGTAAVELLRAARPVGAGPEALVCPGEKTGQPFVAVDKARRRLYAKAGIEGRDLHSLRHSFSSVAADAGLGEFIVAGLLGHRSGSMTSRYVHPDRDPLHQAAELVCGTIAAAMARPLSV